MVVVVVILAVATLGLVRPASGTTDTARITTPEEGSVVHGVTDVIVEHRCPHQVQSARLLVLNALANESYLISPVSLDPVAFAWDTAKTRVGTTILRARLMGCSGPGLETLTERVSVVVGLMPSRSTTTTSTTSTTSTTTTSTTSTTTIPVPTGTVDVTLEVWVADPDLLQDGRQDQLHARCQLRVSGGATVGTVLDEAQRSRCIKFWTPQPGTRDGVLCLDGMCQSVGDEIGAGPDAYWWQTAPLPLDQGDVVRLWYEIRSGRVPQCSVMYGCW